MTVFRHNLLANFAGAIWATVAGLVCTPIYIKLIGIESYGLIGFFIMLQSTLQVLDFGLSPTINREMARYSVQPGMNEENRDFVCTFGICSWGIGITLGIILWSLSPIIADHWIQSSGIPVRQIRNAVSMMAVLITLQWPISFYTGGLLGLQKQVGLNIIKIITITIGSGGALLILWIVSPTITAYFLWHTLVGAIQVFLIMFLLDRSLPASQRPSRFNPSLIRKIWRFATGMSGITLSALILTQLDKIILSKMLDLKMFGYYTLAGVVSSGIYIFITPIFNATFPRFSALVAANDEEQLRHLYHGTAQLMAAFVIPVAAVLSAFSFEIVFLWTGDVEIARHTSPIVRLFVIGTALNGLMFIPYALQLAHGWTKIGLYINTVLILFFIPAIVLLTTRYGAVGGAMAWISLNGIYMAIGVPMTHRRLLQGETARWFARDFLAPLSVTLLIVIAGRILVTDSMRPVVVFAAIGAILCCSIITAGLTAPAISSQVTSMLKRQN